MALTSHQHPLPQPPSPPFFFVNSPSCAYSDIVFRTFETLKLVTQQRKEKKILMKTRRRKKKKKKGFLQSNVNLTNEVIRRTRFTLFDFILDCLDAVRKFCRRPKQEAGKLHEKNNKIHHPPVSQFHRCYRLEEDQMPAKSSATWPTSILSLPPQPEATIP